ARAIHDDRQQVPLLDAPEVRKIFSRGEQRIMIQSVESGALIAKRLIYFRDPQFAGLFTVDRADDAP
ncbi:hypothetical protein ACPXAT_27095, partial [Klebsiella pneumoniae]|uniref:hypothetical protein n=1 Tax=Klebsiella pneumoniae TaxID=573 RepID=UPI003CE99C87